MAEGLPIAKGKAEHVLLPRMANRHGLIAEATGTGKTVTLRVIAENFRTTISEMGPLLMARLLNLNETQSGVLGSIFGGTSTRKR